MAGTRRLKGKPRSFLHLPVLMSRPPESRYLEDDFTGEAASLDGSPPAYSECAASWAVLDGTFLKTGSSRLEVTSLGSGFALASIAALHANARASLIASSPAGGEGLGLAFRIESAANFWLAAFDLSRQTFLLKKVVAGVPADADSLALDNLPAGVDHTITIRLAGDSIQAALNEAYSLSVEDPHCVDASAYGLYALALGSFDRIEVGP